MIFYYLIFKGNDNESWYRSRENLIFSTARVKRLWPRLQSKLWWNTAISELFLKCTATVTAIKMFPTTSPLQSRCLVLLSSLYYIIYSLTITIFSFTVKIERFRDAFCAHIMGSLCLAIIVGNVFCVVSILPLFVLIPQLDYLLRFLSFTVQVYRPFSYFY